jgi:universal stress protein A
VRVLRAGGGHNEPAEYPPENLERKNDNKIQPMKVKPVDKGGVRVELGPQEAQLPGVTGETRTSEMAAFRLKEILVPVDFTECTEKALGYAVPFARQFGATVTLLHVIEPVFATASETMLVDVGTDEDVQRELEKLRTRLAGQVRCRTSLGKGNAALEIIRAARELDCDLIILSTHGRTGLDRLLLGSTAERVVRRAGCPIFVVRPHERDFISDNPEDWERMASPRAAEIEAEMTAGV